MFDDREKEAFAIIRMFNYLENELRVGLHDPHLADLCQLIAEDVMRKHVQSPECPAIPPTPRRMHS